MKMEELLQKIQDGENAYVEFKDEKIKNKDLAEEIVAYANGEGGIIIIGVSDDGSICGVSDEKIEERLMNLCRNNCIPHLIPAFEKYEIDGRCVAVLNIPKGISKPYYTNENKYFIRVGTTKRIATKDELLRLFESNGSFHYDISPQAGTTIRDLNIEVIREYFQKYNTFDLLEEEPKTVERILVNADILTETDNGIVCTVGGLLMFGRMNDKLLPQNGISFAHFKGVEIADELLDKKVISGRIQDVADQALVVLKNNIRIPSKINGVLREEVETYPTIVLREAVVNALVHRNYSILGSKIRIFMFDDRIEFRSPGRLPNTVTIEKMKIGVSYARNPFLVKYMENMRYIDQLGRGIPLIIKTMKGIGAREPDLQEIGEEFVLTVFSI